MPKAHITVTGKTDALVGFINDHAAHLTNYNFFSVACPLPRKHWGIAEEAVEAWGCCSQPYVKVLHDKKPVEQPKDFSLDEAVYELNWSLAVFPPNRWLEQASELYGLQMLLEFTDGNRILILETNTKGEVVLDKELDKASALEYFQIQRRIYGYEEAYKGQTQDSLKDHLTHFRSLADGSSAKVAALLIDVLTEDELRLTLHRYAEDVRTKHMTKRNAEWEEAKKRDPFWILDTKKQKANSTYQQELKALREAGDLHAVAQFQANHADLMLETTKGLTTEYKILARGLCNLPDIEPFLHRVTLQGDGLRTVEFRKVLAKVRKNRKDRVRRAEKREAERKARMETLNKLGKSPYLQPVEAQKINLLGEVSTDNFNLNSLISDEAKSLKGDK